jgi:hypothetical protein
MKKILTTAFFIAMVAFFITPAKLSAAASDTLVVYANGSSLDVIIGSDTTTGGAQAHKVYKLVTLDTTYLYLGTLSIKSDITILGVLGADKRPPCIQPGLTQGGSMPAIFLTLDADHATGVFKNIYFYGSAIDGSWDWGKVFVVTGSYARLILDNLVVDDNRGEVIGYTGVRDNFYVTNCIIRNGVHPTDWFSTLLIASDWPTSNPADSIVIKNSTIFCIDGYAAAAGKLAPLNYFELSHCTVMYNFVAPTSIFMPISSKMNNNIFYCTFAGAEPKSKYPAWFESFSADISSTIDWDTLTVAYDSTFDPADAGSSNWRMLAEAKRSAECKNNAYFQPKGLTDFWANWNDTVKVLDSLYLPVWMNNRTKGMFTDKTHWPNFNESGNVNADPGFGTSVTDVLTSGNDNGVSLLTYVAEVLNGTETTDIWGYKNQVVSGDNWIPTWPLPESADMQYSNAALKSAATDALPIGDYRWFNSAASFSVVSKGDSYTSSYAPSPNYPDANSTKLTDGAFCSTQWYADPAEVGYNADSDTLNVVIDLKNTTSVQQFMADLLYEPGVGAYVHNTDISVSTDNTNFTKLGTLIDVTPGDTTKTCTHKCYLTLSTPVDARYVMFTTHSKNSWYFVDELEVLAASVTGIKNQPTTVPAKYALSNNYPNPFNPSTNINFSIEKSSKVTLAIYNVLGQKVATLVNNYMQAGSYTYQFNASKLASGVYIYRIEAGNFVSAKKMILMK